MELNNESIEDSSLNEPPAKKRAPNMAAEVTSAIADAALVAPSPKGKGKKKGLGLFSTDIVSVFYIIYIFFFLREK